MINIRSITSLRAQRAWQSRSNKKGIVFITTLAVMVILLTLGAGYLFISRTQIDISLNQGNALKAFYIAQAGVEKAISELIADIGWRTRLAENFGGGNYTVTVTDIGGENIRVASVGIFSGASRTIKAEVNVASGVGYASQSASNINFSNSTGNIRKGNVHADGTADIGSVTLDSGYTTTQGFTLTMPAVDWDAYKNEAIAAGTFVSGPKKFNKDSSGIWYIDGNATIQSGVTITGTIVATGNIQMQNNEDITITPTGNYPALVTQNKILMNNSEDVTITGLVYSGSDFIMNNSEGFKLNNGALIVGGLLRGNDSTTVDITYSSGLNPPYFTWPGISVTSWKGHP